MLSHYEKFVLHDANKLYNFHAEVNWNAKDKSTNQCKVIKFTFPDGKEAYIKKELLNALMFVIGTEEEQRNLIPQKVKHVKMLKTVLGIKATKDIYKGEMINVPVEIPIPDYEEEIIGEIKTNPENYIKRRNVV